MQKLLWLRSTLANDGAEASLPEATGTTGRVGDTVGVEQQRVACLNAVGALRPIAGGLEPEQHSRRAGFDRVFARATSERQGVAGRGERHHDTIVRNDKPG